MPRIVTLAAIAAIGLSAWWFLSSFDIFYEPGKCESFVTTESLGPVIIGPRIDRGSFSLVVEGLASESNQRVAVKIGMHPLANTERDYEILSKFNNTRPFPLYYGSGLTRCAKKISGRVTEYPYIVIEKLGRPVSALTEMIPERSERIKAAAQVALQVLDGLEMMHDDLHMLMHDIYTENILLADSEELQVKLVDFGEAVKMVDGGFYNQINPVHTTVREDKGERISQRDDLERLVYVMMQIVDGRLAWEEYQDDSLKHRKLHSPFGKREYPENMKTLLQNAREELGYGEPIDFDYCRTLLRAI
jgi:casein kinase I family protein HRR25